MSLFIDVQWRAIKLSIGLYFKSCFFFFFFKLEVVTLNALHEEIIFLFGVLKKTLFFFWWREISAVINSPVHKLLFPQYSVVTFILDFVYLFNF